MSCPSNTEWICSYITFHGFEWYIYTSCTVSSMLCIYSCINWTQSQNPTRFSVLQRCRLALRNAMAKQEPELASTSVDRGCQRTLQPLRCFRLNKVVWLRSCKGWGHTILMCPCSIYWCSIHPHNLTAWRTWCRYHTITQAAPSKPRWAFLSHMVWSVKRKRVFPENSGYLQWWKTKK